MESYRSFHSPGNTEASFDSPQETGTNREAGGSTPEAGQQANESVTAPPRNTDTSEDTGPADPFSVDPSSYTGRLQNLGSARESLKHLLLSLDVSKVSDRLRSKSNIYS